MAAGTIDSLNIQISAQVEQATRNISQLNSTLDTLQKKIRIDTNVFDLNRVTETTKRFSNAVANLRRTTSNVFRTSGSGASSFMTSLKQSIPLINKTSKSTDTLIGKLGRLYVAYYSLRRIGRIFSGIVNSASDYIEEFNYFNVSISKIAKESQGDYKKYGYDSAEEYAESFKTRLTELTTKMSGFKIGENGELFTSSLGLDVTEITNFESRIAQMTNSVGMIGEASIAASKGLTMLSGDLSSLANVPLGQVMNNLSSGLAGASMAVKKYGIDISVATLKEQAASLGIEKSVLKMSQAEKEYLRVITMINQSKVAWGDLANTINQPANQFRMLKNNLKQISLLIGNMFMPMIQKVMPYINAMAIAVKDLIQWISDLFGLKWKNTAQALPDTGEFDSSYDDLISDAEDAADATDKAADAQKKYNKQLQSFDELNNLTTTKNKDKDKDNDKDGADADVSGVLSDALIRAVEDYEKRWKKAFESMENSAANLAKTIEDLFKRAWDTGDGTEIGEAIATTLNKAITWVNEHTDKFSEGLDKIASILGTSLNGAIEKFDFPGLGKAVGNSIKAALGAEEKFFDTVDWTTLGSNLATSLNTAIETGVLQQSFSTMASKIKAAIETAFGAITTFKFKSFGTAVGEGINDFFAKMNEVNKKTGKNGWEELAISFSEGVKGALEAAIATVTTIHWEDIGQAIATLISNMDTDGIGWELGKLANSLATAFYVLVSKRETWKLLGEKIAGGINGFFKGMNEIDPETGLTGFQKLGKSISNTITGVLTSVSTAINKTEWEEIGKNIVDFFANINWIEILTNAAELIFAVGKGIFGLLKGALTEVAGYLKEYLPVWIESLGKFFISIGVKIGTTIEAFGEKIANFIKKLPQNIILIALKISNTVSGFGEKIAEFILKLPSQIISVALKISTTTTNFAIKITRFMSELPKYALDIAMRIGTKVADFASKMSSFLLKLPKYAILVLAKIGTTVKKFREAVNDFLSKLPKFALLIAMKISTTVKKLGEKIEEIISDLPRYAIPIALKVVKGIKNIAVDIPKYTVSVALKISTTTTKFAAKVTQFMAELPKYVLPIAAMISNTATDFAIGVTQFMAELPKYALPIVIEIATTAADIAGQIARIISGVDIFDIIKKAITGETTESESTDVTVKYIPDTKELEKANEMAEADHKNTTSYETNEKQLDKAIKKAKENHDSDTKFLASPTDKFNKAIENVESVIGTKTSTIKFKAKGDISKLNSIIDNVLIPNEKKFKITLDVATKGMGSAAVNNLPWNKHAKGSRGLPADELGVVNDQKGNTYKELIIPPHGTPFIPDGRNVILPMQKGTKVIPAGKTKKFIDKLPHFANGTETEAGAKQGSKKSTGGIADGVSQAINDTLIPYIREIIRILQGNASSGGSAASKKKTTTKYADTVKEIQAAWTGLSKWFETTVVEPITKGFNTMKEELVKIFDATNQELTQKYTEASTEWQGVLNEIPGWIDENIGKSITSNFTNFCSGIKSEIETVWGNIQEVLSPIPEWIENNITSAVKNKFTGIFGDIETSHNTMWNIMSQYASGKTDWISAIADAAFTRFSYRIDEFEKKLQALERNINLTEGEIRQAENMLNETSGRLSDIKRQIEDAQSAANNLKETSKPSNNNYITQSIAEIPRATQHFVENNISRPVENMLKPLLENLKVTSNVRVKRYAAGGFPEDGWFRASHGEIMGQFDNGQSVVANNYQITNGIATAVQEANQEGNMLMRQEINLLQRQNDLLMGILQKETGINSNDIFRAVQQEDAIFYKRTHRGAFEH